jgi:CPA2 family monovalent cation:H+ antiporter-2
MPALAAGPVSLSALAMPLLIALAKAAVFALLVWFVGSRVFSRIMERIARTRSDELFTLGVFVAALGIAVIATSVFQVSVALGAFFAGLVVGQSRFGPQAASFMTPFRDVFSALFFVSVGMLFNPSFVLTHPLMVLASLAVVLVAKPLIAVVIVRLMRESRAMAATVGVGLSQIGEFSFILATLGVSLRILPPEGLDALVVTAIFTNALNPVLFRLLLRREHQRGVVDDDAASPTATDAAPAITHDGPAPAIVITGTGELARRITESCLRAGIPLIAVSDNLEVLDAEAASGVRTVFGNPARADVLNAAGIAEARAIVVTNVLLAETMAICIAARAQNPRIRIIATAANSAERAWLQEFGVTSIADALDGLTDALKRSIRQAL